MSAHSGPSIHELVRRDLIHRESEGDSPGAYYVGSEALLDAYHQALDLACHLRAIIEEAHIGDRPELTSVPDRPYTEDDAKIVALTFVRKATP